DTPAATSTSVVAATQTQTPSDPDADRYGGNLRIVSQASITTLDPLWSLAYVPVAVATHIYDTPFGWDSTLNPQPRMVGSWSVSSDAKTYTFVLRDGLRFHDDTPVTAEDVAVSLTRWISSAGPHASFARNFAADPAFRAKDANTFEFVLTEGYGAVLSNLGSPDQPPVIMPKAIASVTFTTEVTDQTGSGPYKFSKWDHGHQVILERFDGYVARSEPTDYFSGATTPYFDQLIWLEIPDEETKVAGLETGEWDVLDGAGLDFYNRLNSNPDIGVQLYKPGHRTNIILNPNIAPFGNPESEAPAGQRLTAQAIAGRQAVATGINVADVMASLGPSDLWTVCAAIYYCGTPLESDAGAEYYNRNDKARAREFMNASGYDGETIVLLNPTDYATITPTGFVIKQELEQIGFTVDMPANDWATVVTTFTTKTDNWNALASWTVHWCCGDPISDEAAAADTNFWPKIPGVQELRIAWAKETDPEKKMALLDELQIKLYEQVEIAYLGIFYSLYPHRADLQNYHVKAFPYFAGTWIEK
ncbi:MAG: ABC transporter substrate-binding protein, partial [Chloroflexi bacterium]|nr:ABC transporter substrate-binding protein [Chloroflexota bacterium]